MDQNQRGDLRHDMALGARQLQGLGLLAKSLPELRSEIVREVSENPVLEDIDSPLETPLSAVERAQASAESDEMPDYPDDGYQPVVDRDGEAAERRQAFFDNQVGEETLQHHLIAQFPLSDIPKSDWVLAELLVGDLDGGGYYRGSLADICMSFGRTEAEVRAILARIGELDPPGCGAITVRECLLSQLDAMPPSRTVAVAREIADRHLNDVADGNCQKVADVMRISLEEYFAAIRTIQSLNARPGSAYPDERERVEYVNPEVHAVKSEGRWYALTDKRSLPELRISKRYLGMLRDPNLAEDAKHYVRERIAAAEALREAVAKRQQTIENIAQTIFDRQQEFFEHGFAALHPLTETEVAGIVGLDVSTVSRTVRDKYASTPHGTVELRRFFVLSVRNGDGESFTPDEAKRCLRRIIDSEDRANPLSDARLVTAMGEAGYHLARRTIAKYRESLGIPGAAERKVAS